MPTSVNSELTQSTVVLRVPGRLDVITAKFLGRDLKANVQKGTYVKIDLSQTTFIDSTGINTILEGLIQAKKRQAKIALKGLTPQVRVALELAGVLAHFRQ
ncbi:STAS domain-containing protein [Leptolyngbya sp. FACHB-261]|uniref:STAS domain-containing protein n=1 Tax=Leptolyngbya sp. FACHB-261 TaxID=2692806 RepID=UPI0016840593|nr:STAS domain-containing protein [Leptolyngbya sp. FACHB-261]MBD2100643.1 STAS domain-containing protein [Leptolyngbya sp. FACHB-261]